QQLEVARRPQVNRAVLARRRELGAIGAQSQPLKGLSSGELAERTARRHVPKLGRVVRSPRSYASPVGTEGDRQHMFGVSLRSGKGADFLGRPHIPELQRVIETAGEEKLA